MFGIQSRNKTRIEKITSQIKTGTLKTQIYQRQGHIIQVSKALCMHKAKIGPMSDMKLLKVYFLQSFNHIHPTFFHGKGLEEEAGRRQRPQMGRSLPNGWRHLCLARPSSDLKREPGPTSRGSSTGPRGSRTGLSERLRGPNSSPSGLLP